MRRISLVVVLFCSLSVASPVATAQFGGTGGLQTESAPEPQAPNQQDDDGFGATETFLVLLGGGLLLGGIAWAILRDARGQLPGDDGHEEDRKRSQAEREADHVRRKQQSRKKGKAAKKARRHNRPR